MAQVDIPHRAQEAAVASDVGRARTALAVVLLASLALRVPGMFHDFWLDEAWSYLIVRGLASPLEILTRAHIDNNHPLNSWFLYALGDRTAWIIYRIPSLVLGTGSVLLAGLVMSRSSDRVAAACALLLVGCSYPLIVYASEARGYAPMIFFVLLAVDAAGEYSRTHHRRALVTFWAASALGFLSHLTFLHAYAAILVSSAYTAWTRAGRPRAAIATIVTAHGVPLAFLAALYLLYGRHLQVAGAEFAGWPSVVAETSAVAIGLPARGGWLLIAPILVAALLTAALMSIERRDTGLFLLFITGIVVAPALNVALELRHAVIEPRFFPRYFLVSITLSLLLMAWFAGEQWRRGSARRLATVLALGLYVTLSLWQVATFVRVGRGHYRDALSDMAARTAGSVIRLSSNSDLRTTVLLDFYRRYAPAGKTVSFYPHGSTRAVEADWRIVETLEPDAIVPAEVDDGSGHRYRLMKHFPFYGLSGCGWSVYERLEPSPATAAERSAR
jgi:hypothetical protein